MHVILTHEQADFDALASLLGAYLLDETAIPVLPRRMNRNVSAFITLYGLELPFVDPRDLPKQRIERITLVDTQSLTTIKGMQPDTKITVIDHHTLRTDLPKDWVVRTEHTGAATTLFVESLQTHNGPLTTVQATLLLLGLYEDTGSLTYTRTTPRDVRAAAYLLEQGASLQIANEFLNHPLSLEQQKLYDHLRETAETHQINGHAVVIATGDATEMEAELSTIAHKLRDLLDPEALFLIIRTRGGVQLITRSTSDYIDVSTAAAHFGGGGHPRAAAARVRDGELEDVHTELVEKLPGWIRPAITVAELMSSGPQILAPDTPVSKAAERMQRYGYEGYPVVADGQVVGLLTRGAVDRALNHNLNLTAGDLMEAGQVTIAPNDSVEVLQEVMTDSGWGQIPVVKPDTGEIIGIVTRTDLLKTLTPQTASSGRQNLAAKLENTLPAAQLAILRMVAAAAVEQHAALYIVGGFVRDLLLERPSLDYDVVVEGDAIALALPLVRKYGGRVVTHRRFGTAKWQIGEIREKLTARLGSETGSLLDPADLPDSLDLVSARREFYTAPSALPTVERGSIKLDLHRRDFTINTLALRLDGRHYGDLHDYWGGVSDLQNGLIRVLHSLSFVDDPTRILRAVRFEQRFAFQIEARTLELLRAALPLLDRVSGDRMRHELNAILREEHNLAMLDRLAELDVIPAIHPALVWDGTARALLAGLKIAEPGPEWELDDLVSSNELQRDLSYVLWLSPLAADKAQAVGKRLRLPQALLVVIAEAQLILSDLENAAGRHPSAVVARLEKVPALAIYAAFLLTKDAEIKTALHTYVREWQHITPSVDGHDLQTRGLPPGPHYREILNALRAAWVDGRITSPAEEQSLLEMLIQEHAPTPEQPEETEHEG